MRNSVLEKFRAGERCVGTFTHLLSTAAIQGLGQTGLDYVIIDLEHSPTCTDEAAKFVSAARVAGLCPLVRVDAIARSPILKMLDVGALGIIVPQVESAEQVRTLIDYAKFAPLGSRGYCPTADAGWGFGPEYTGGIEDYMRTANERTLLLPQCETLGCLEHVEEIAAMEGVAGIFIGPYDLSIALGIPGQFDNPVHMAAVERIRVACERAQKLSVMFCGSGEQANGYFRQGFPNVAVGIDMLTLISGTRATVEEAKRA